MPDDLPSDRLPVPRRAELEAPYRHPYRLGAKAAWRTAPYARGLSVLAGVMVVGGTIGAVAASQPLLWLTVATGAALAAYVLAVLGGATAKNALGLLRFWRQKSELRQVREHRPHAGDADRDVAHDEFAVTAEDDGWLLTWRFRPLAFEDRPEDHEVLVPGRPCYAASVVTEARFDAHDAARAAEQLVAAQEAAAVREAAAAGAAYGGIEDAAARADLAIEARTTAAALQRATGQQASKRRRRD